MKSGQLIEYSMRDVFVKNLYTKYDEESSSRPFFEKSKLVISLVRQPGISYNLLLLYV